MIMKTGDRVKLVQPIGVYSIGCKGTVKHVGNDGYVDVTLDQNEIGVSYPLPKPLPPSNKNKFIVI